MNIICEFSTCVSNENGETVIVTAEQEDALKLTEDYAALTEQYSREAQLFSGFPIICDCWLYDKNIQIRDIPEKKYSLPEIAQKNEDVLFLAHSKSRIYDNTNIRVDHWEIDENGDFVMETSRTTYFSSLLTNRAADFRLPDGTTLREKLYSSPLSLKESSFSNHLGFNGWIESADGFFPLIRRSGHLSIGKNTYADSVCASMKAKYALSDGRLTLEGIHRAILLETEDELKIDSSSLDPKPTLVAAYRDLVEAGKPQLLFYIRSQQTKEEIEEHFYKTIDDYDKKNLIIDGAELLWIHRSQLDSLAVQPDGILLEDIKYSMMPSSAAGIVMLKEYLNSVSR